MRMEEKYLKSEVRFVRLSAEPGGALAFVDLVGTGVATDFQLCELEMRVAHLRENGFDCSIYMGGTTYFIYEDAMYELLFTKCTRDTATGKRHVHEARYKEVDAGQMARIFPGLKSWLEPAPDSLIDEML